LISINRITSRHIRARHSCTIAKSIDTLPTGAFDRNLSDHLFAFADLNSDQKLDLIQGFEEEPYNTTNIREPVNYKVFMSDGSQFPKNLPNLLARKILVQDLNLDEMDDLVFLNAGPHKPPRPGLTNRILISGDEGYTFRELPGGSKISHGGAAGDLDRDGDIDIIVANGQQEEVQILVNLRNGRFKSKLFMQSFPANLTPLKFGMFIKMGCLTSFLVYLQRESMFPTASYLSRMPQSSRSCETTHFTS
jgi:hypothetical protein